MRKSKADLETKLKLLGSSLYNDAFVFEYNQCKKQQKQPPSGVPRKRCSENMQEMYRRTPMPKCDFNKVAVAPSHGCSVNFLHTFRTPFPRNTTGWLLLKQLEEIFENISEDIRVKIRCQWYEEGEKCTNFF